jgi:hypothetical protein
MFKINYSVKLHDDDGEIVCESKDIVTLCHSLVALHRESNLVVTVEMCACWAFLWYVPL